MSAADKLLEELAAKVDALERAKAVVDALKAEVARTAALLVLESGGEAPPLQGAAREPPKPVRPRPARKKTPGRRASKRPARAATLLPGGVEPGASVAFGGSQPRQRQGGRQPGVPTLREVTIALLRRQGPMGEADITAALGRNPTSVQRTLRKLTSDGSLVRNDGPGEEPSYSLQDGAGE